jgi:hypothetical protein
LHLSKIRRLLEQARDVARCFGVGGNTSCNHRLLRCLRYDTEIKTSLYARHGIPEYWIIDLHGRQVRLFRSPKAGQYTDITSMAEPGNIAPVALPGVRVDLAHILEA